MKSLYHLAPFFPGLFEEDLCHLCLELVKVIKLRKIIIADAKLLQKGLVELRLNAPDGHVEVVGGSIGFIEVDARVQHVVAPGGE